MIGTADHSRSRRVTSTPSRSGRPEVEQHEVGRARRRLDEGLLAGRRLEHAVAVRGQASRAGSAAPAARPRRPGPARPAPSPRRFSSRRAHRRPPRRRRRRRVAERQREAEGVAPRLAPSPPRCGRRGRSRWRGRSEAEAEAAAGPTRRGRTSRRRAPPSPAGRPGPSSATSTATRVARRVAPRRRSARRGVRVLDRVLEQVHERLLDSTPSTGTSGQVRRDLDPHGAARAGAGSSARQGRADQLLERVPVAVELQRARLEPRHVEQVGRPAG